MHKFVSFLTCYGFISIKCKWRTMVVFALYNFYQFLRCWSRIIIKPLIWSVVKMRYFRTKFSRKLEPSFSETKKPFPWRILLSRSVSLPYTPHQVHLVASTALDPRLNSKSKTAQKCLFLSNWHSILNTDLRWKWSKGAVRNNQTWNWIKAIK